MPDKHQDGQPGAGASRSIDDEFAELPQNVINGISKTQDRFIYGLKLEHINIAEEYLDGRIGILVEFDRKAGAKAHDPSPAIWPHAKFVVCESRHNRTIWINDFHMADGSDAGSWSQNCVLVRVIEQMEAVNFLAPATWVCRETDEEFFRVGVGCFYSITRGFVILPSVTHRESGMAILCTAIDPDQFPRRMVKRRSEIMNRVAENQRELAWDLLAEANLNGHPASVRIAADAKSMGVALHKSIECDLQINDVMFGPL